MWPSRSSRLLIKESQVWGQEAPFLTGLHQWLKPQCPTKEKETAVTPTQPLLQAWAPSLPSAKPTHLDSALCSPVQCRKGCAVVFRWNEAGMEKTGLGPAVAAVTCSYLATKASLCRSWLRFSDAINGHAVSLTWNNPCIMQWKNGPGIRVSLSSDQRTKHMQVSNEQVSHEQTCHPYITAGSQGMGQKLKEVTRRISQTSGPQQTTATGNAEHVTRQTSSSSPQATIVSSGVAVILQPFWDPSGVCSTWQQLIATAVKCQIEIVPFQELCEQPWRISALLSFGVENFLISPSLQREVSTG